MIIRIPRRTYWEYCVRIEKCNVPKEIQGGLGFVRTAYIHIHDECIHKIENMKMKKFVHENLYLYLGEDYLWFLILFVSNMFAYIISKRTGENLLRVCSYCIRYVVFKKKIKFQG